METRSTLLTFCLWNAFPDSKVQGANMGPIWSRQNPGGPYVGPMSFALRVGHRWIISQRKNFYVFSLLLGFNKLLNKELNCQWFETPWCPCDVTVMKQSFYYLYIYTITYIHFKQNLLLSYPGSSERSTGHWASLLSLQSPQLFWTQMVLEIG